MTDELKALLDAFKLESYPNQWAGQPDELEFRPVAELVDPNVAEGECHEVSTFFIAWLAERGVKAALTEWWVDDNDGSWKVELGDPRGGYHAAVLVDGFRVDWTASQLLGRHDFPHIEEL